MVTHVRLDFNCGTGSHGFNCGNCGSAITGLIVDRLINGFNCGSDNEWL